FADRPDDKRLPASHIACGENAGDAGHFLGVGGDIAAFVDCDAELVEHAISLGSEEAHCKQDKIGVQSEFRPGDFLHIAAFEFDADSVKLCDLAIAAGEALRENAEFAAASFLMRRRRAEYVRPIRPWILRSTLSRRFWKQFELNNGASA